MTTFYFIASVANATSKQIRTSASESNRAVAFAAVALRLQEDGFDMTQIQNISASQYRAAIGVPLTEEVCIKVAPVTISPAFPV